MTSRLLLVLLLLASPVGAIQCLVPTVDQSGFWDVPNAGSNHSVLIDDDTACDGTNDDTTTQIREDDGSNVLVNTTSATDPEVSTGHTWYCYAYRSSNKAHTLTIDLYESGSKVNTSTTCTHSGLGDTYAKTTVCTLNATEADSITDYTDLELSLTATVTNPTDIFVTSCNIELPDAPSAGDQLMVIGTRNEETTQPSTPTR